MSKNTSTSSTTTSVEKPAEPEFQAKVVIDDDVYQKIMHWVHKAAEKSLECSGLGKVVYDEEANVFRVIDAIMVKQENTRSTTEMDPNAIGEAMYKLRETDGMLNWWWHSHVKMGVFWSGTDHDAIRQLGGPGWFIATVFNVYEEMRSCYYQAKPFRVFADHLETEVERQIDEDLVTAWDAEYDECVTEKTYSYSSYSTGRWNNFVSGKTSSLPSSVPSTRGPSTIIPGTGLLDLEEHDDLDDFDTKKNTLSNEIDDQDELQFAQEQMEELWDSELDELEEFGYFESNDDEEAI